MGQSTQGLGSYALKINTMNFFLATAHSFGIFGKLYWIELNSIHSRSKLTTWMRLIPGKISNSLNDQQLNWIKHGRQTELPYECSIQKFLCHCAPSHSLSSSSRRKEKRIGEKENEAMERKENISRRNFCSWIVPISCKHRLFSLILHSS